MFKQLALSFLFFGLSSTDQDGLKEIRETINTWNWDVQCWGEQNVLNQRLSERRSCEYCMQLPTEPLVTGSFLRNNIGPYSYPLQPAALPTNFIQSPYLTNILSPSLIRGKRHAYTVNNKIHEFLEDVEDFTHQWDSKLSNLTCVLKTMGYINEDLTLNRAAFEIEFFKKIDISATDNLADPIWRQKTTGMLTDCIDTSNSIPQSKIDNNPISRRYGPLSRCMLFMKCAKVGEYNRSYVFF